MDDLVKRLREIARTAPPSPPLLGETVGVVVNLPGASEREAADRIEALEAALKEADAHAVKIEGLLDPYINWREWP